MGPIEIAGSHKVNGTKPDLSPALWVGAYYDLWGTVYLGTATTSYLDTWYGFPHRSTGWSKKQIAKFSRNAINSW